MSGFPRLDTHVMKYLRRLPMAGEKFTRLPKAGCLWCTEGRDPEPPDEICPACHKAFKQLLCSKAWNKTFRLARLSENPHCQDCKTNPASTVDHVEPWKRKPSRFWDETNTRCLCHGCHNVKTNSEDGGGWRRNPSPRKKL